MDIHQLIVRFERDWPEKAYPYLGGLCLLGMVNSLLDGYDCKRPIEFLPAFATPEAQRKMGEVLHGGENTGERIDAFLAWTPPPFWVLPQEGWRTARCLQAALETDRVSTLGLTDVMGALVTESNDWMSLMERAIQADIRFQVGVEKSLAPPEALIQFNRRKHEEAAEMICEILDDCGFNLE
jgi:hypothetical protein